MPDITTIVIPEAVFPGTILPTGSDHDDLPDGYLLCDGAAVSRTTFLPLFAVIATKYGVGDGSTTFNVPDFRDNFPKGAPNLDNGGGTGGVDTVTLTTAQMPIHTHIQNSHTHTYLVSSFSTTGTFGGNTSDNAGSNSTTGTGGTTPTNQNAGSGSSHENKPPFVECPFMIKT